MNPMLASKYAQLQEQVAELRGILEASRDDVRQQHAEKEELLQEKWVQRKRLTTLNRIAEDYDTVEAENTRYRGERLELRASLKTIISSTKALHTLKKS
jgi:cell shape-determining protein MreC